MKGFKWVHVPDIHLSHMNTTGVKEMAQDSLLRLERLIEMLEDDKDICLLTFGGDIQDRVPNNLYYIDSWKRMFERLNGIMREPDRLDRVKNIRYTGLTEEEKGLFKEGKLSPILSNRGNHDYVKVLQRREGLNQLEENYTFFDSLLESNLINNAKGMAFSDGERNFYIDNRNFGEADRKIKKLKDRVIVANLHDNVITSESSLWQLQSKDLYKAEEVLENVDIGLLNHIHKRVDPLYIETSVGKESILWQIGSYGRMKYNEDEKRDVGYLGLLNTENILEVSIVEIDLLPIEEYFNQDRIQAKRKLEKSRKEMNLGMGEIWRNEVSPVEDIRKLEKDDFDLEMSEEEFKEMKMTAIDIMEEFVK